MAYRVKINNVLIEADTLPEVIELLKKVPPLPANTRLAIPIFEWNLASVARFLDSISDQPKQLAVLSELKDAAPGGVLKEELTEELGTSGQQLGGVLSGLVKNSKRFSFDPVVEIEHTSVDGERTCRYFLRDKFLEAWAQLEIDTANDARAALKKSK
jgi:hypothetical protein